VRGLQIPKGITTGWNQGANGGATGRASGRHGAMLWQRQRSAPIGWSRLKSGGGCFWWCIPRRWSAALPWH